MKLKYDEALSNFAFKLNSRRYTEAVTSHQMECLSPAHTPRSVPVDMSTNLKDFTAAELMFSYRHAVTVLAVSPESAPATGGAIVTVRRCRLNR